LPRQFSALYQHYDRGVDLSGGVRRGFGNRPHDPHVPLMASRIPLRVRNRRRTSRRSIWPLAASRVRPRPGTPRLLTPARVIVGVGRCAQGRAMGRHMGTSRRGVLLRSPSIKRFGHSEPPRSGEIPRVPGEPPDGTWDREGRDHRPSITAFRLGSAKCDVLLE